MPDVPILKKVWWFDCLPPEFRNAPFYAHDGKGDEKIHPCDIIATPVFYRNRVYAAIGGDPQHGSKNSRGRLVCFDATRTGNVTRSGFLWSYEKLNATLTTVAIADGLLFVIDEAGAVHCLDADTGRKYWAYELKSDRGLLASALLVADGKVFVGKSILAASKTLKILSTVKSMPPPVAARRALPMACCLRSTASVCGRSATRKQAPETQGNERQVLAALVERHHEFQANSGLAFYERPRPRTW